jgi:glycosyltransferase involved in cell wall biosynthesis
VVIPAHNEAAVIARGLRRLGAGALPGELEVVVVCNGCDDDTATVARAAAPDAMVVELTEASKSAALNAGDERATRFPRFYVDADVEVSIEAVRATAAVLAQGDVLCAAPRPVFDLDDVPGFSRSFYTVLARMPFLSGPGVVGTGVYAMSRAGRERFGPFPPITADDQYVMDRFSERERRAVPDVTFVVHPPSTVRGLLNVRTRVYRGRRELRSRYEPAEVLATGNRDALVRLARDRETRPAVPVYVAVNVAARVQALRRWSGRWERDDSSRAGVPVG